MAPIFLKIRNLSSDKFGKAEISQVFRLRPRTFRRIESARGHDVLLLAALRLRAVALARNRSIWPLGRVTQISPIHSSLTPLIGLALKLVRLTRVADFPRSMVFRYRSPVFRRPAASSPEKLDSG